MFFSGTSSYLFSFYTSLALIDSLHLILPPGSRQCWSPTLSELLSAVTFQNALSGIIKCPFHMFMPCLLKVDSRSLGRGLNLPGPFSVHSIFTSQVQIIACWVELKQSTGCQKWPDSSEQLLNIYSIASAGRIGIKLHSQSQPNKPFPQQEHKELVKFRQTYWNRIWDGSSIYHPRLSAEKQNLHTTTA